LPCSTASGFTIVNVLFPISIFIKISKRLQNYEN